MENLPKLIESCVGEAGRNMPGLRIYNEINARLRVLEFIFDIVLNSNPVAPLPYPLCRAYDHYDDMLKEDMLKERHNKIVNTIRWQIAKVKWFKSRLVINNTIDHVPEFAAKWSRYVREWPVGRLYEFSGVQRPVGEKDQWSRYLARSTYAARYNEYQQRIESALLDANEKGWYVIFDTLTIDPLLEDKFFDNPNAIRDYVRTIGRSVAKACGLRASDSYEHVFKYFGVPEYGKQKGRLHFHLLYLCKEKPVGTVDPNMGRKVRNLREIRCLKKWPYGYNTPIAVRYSGDAFTKSGWLWPVDKNGKPMDQKPVVAVGRYVTKYVTKDQKDRNRWIRNNPNRKATFRIRASRNFGLTLNLSMLSLNALQEASCLHYSVTRNVKLIRKSAKKMLSMNLAKVSIKNFLDQRPKTIGLLEHLRDLTRKTEKFNQQNFIASLIWNLRITDISDELRQWICGYEAIYRNKVPISAK